MTIRAVTDMLDTMKESLDEFTRDGGMLDRINRLGGVNSDSRELETPEVEE